MSKVIIDKLEYQTLQSKVKFLEALHVIGVEEWDKYIELATEKNMSYKNINVLESASRKAGISKYLSPKVINWVLSLIDQLEESKEDDGFE